MDQVSTTGDPTAAVMTVPELARLLGMNSKHVYALAKRGKLPKPITVEKVGRRIVIPKAGVRRFLALDGDESE